MKSKKNEIPSNATNTEKTEPSNTMKIEKIELAKSIKTEKESPKDRSTSRASTLKLESVETSEEKVPFRSLSVVAKIKFLINFFTVEPFLVCYAFPSAISSVTVQKFNIEKACLVNLNFGNVICGMIADGNTTTILNETTATTTLIAKMEAWSTPLRSGIPCLLILFVGAWSDRTGNRKLLMLLALVGEIVTSSGLLLATFFFYEWPLAITAVIESVPTAFSGGFAICLMSVYSYMADITTTEERTFRVGIVAVIVTFVLPLGSAISGFLTQSLGYYGIFSLNLVIYILGLVYVSFRIHNVRSDTDTQTTGKLKWLVEFFDPNHVWNTVKILFRKRPAHMRLCVWLTIIVHLIIIGPVFGELPVLFLYTLTKYQFNIIEFSLFITYITMVGLLGTIIAITVFSKFLKLHDTVLGIIATTSKVASSLIYALSPNKSWFYAAPVVDVFGNSGVTAIRSLGTKVVDPDEVGRMASVIGLVDAFAPVVYTPLYALVYAATSESLPGAFYLLGGAMTVPAFVVFITIYRLQQKIESSRVQNPASKEQFAYDNEVTKL